MKYIDDDNDVTIGKELEIVNSSSRTHISDLALHEKIKERVPKVTISSTNWAIRTWEEWGMKRNSDDVNWNDEFPTFRSTLSKYFIKNSTTGWQNSWLKFERKELARSAERCYFSKLYYEH